MVLVLGIAIIADLLVPDRCTRVLRAAMNRVITCRVLIFVIPVCISILPHRDNLVVMKTTVTKTNM